MIELRKKQAFAQEKFNLLKLQRQMSKKKKTIIEEDKPETPQMNFRKDDELSERTNSRN